MRIASGASKVERFIGDCNFRLQLVTFLWLVGVLVLVVLIVITPTKATAERIETAQELNQDVTVSGGEVSEEADSDFSLEDQREEEIRPHPYCAILIGAGLIGTTGLAFGFGLLSTTVWGAYTSGVIQGISAMSVSGLALWRVIADSESDGGSLQDPRATVPFITTFAALSGYNFMFGDRHLSTTKFFVNFVPIFVLGVYYSVYVESLVGNGDKRKTAQSVRAGWSFGVGARSVGVKWRF